MRLYLSSSHLTPKSTVGRMNTSQVSSLMISAFGPQARTVKYQVSLSNEPRISRSEMQEEYFLKDASTLVPGNGLYRVLDLYAQLKISQVKRLFCLALKPTHPTWWTNSTTQTEVESFLLHPCSSERACSNRHIKPSGDSRCCCESSSQCEPEMAKWGWHHIFRLEQNVSAQHVKRLV